MNRTVIAFIVAPFWAPVLAGAVYISMSPNASNILWSAVAVGVLQSAVVAYLGAFVLGLPALLFLRSRKMTALWVAAVSGCIIGAVWGIMFTTCFLFVFGGMDAVQKALSGNGNLIQMSFSPALLGTIVGTTFWLIARPNRAERAGV